jgi:hypothetical protein
MKTVFLVLVGAALGFLVLEVSVYLYALLPVWSLFSVEWLKHHVALILAATKAVAFLPGIFLLGVLFAKLFRTRAVLWALVANLIALLVAFANTFLTPALIIPTLRLTWDLFAPFLIGPPLIVYFLGRLRSNKRWKGP